MMPWWQEPLISTCDRSSVCTCLRPPSWTSSDNITDDALDGESLLDQLFQDSCNRQFELPAVSSQLVPLLPASSSQLVALWLLEAAPSDILLAPASDGVNTLSVRELPLDSGGRNPRTTLDFAINDLDGQSDANVLVLDGSLDKGATGHTALQAGHLSSPTPPMPLSSPTPHMPPHMPLSHFVFPCLVDDSSLPEPHATVGPGGRPLHKTLKNGSPRRKLTVYKRGGVLQFPLVNSIKIKVGIIKEHVARIPDVRKSQSATVNPLLGVTTLVMSKDEYVDMPRELYPMSNDQQTATKNLGKDLCSFAMTSDPRISKTGTYMLISSSILLRLSKIPQDFFRANAWWQSICWLSRHSYYCCKIMIHLYDSTAKKRVKQKRGK